MVGDFPIDPIREGLMLVFFSNLRVKRLLNVID